MNRLYKPYLILITITIPQVFIFTIFSRVFYIINSELTKGDISTWTMLGSLLVALWAGFTIYGLLAYIRKKQISIVAAFLMFSSYIVFLLMCFFKYDSIIPSSITNWMLLGIRPGITILTLIMPAFIHSMLLIVHWTMEKYSISISRDFLFLIGIPAFWYMFIQIFFVWGSHKSEIVERIVPVTFIISVVVFLFFFVRIITVVLKKKEKIWHKYLALLVFFGSLMGLSLNQSFGNIMGDFSHHYFYILNIITGILMLIPDIQNRKIRLGLFIAKSVTFVFTFYFFIVFLPYAPLSLFGIIIVGLGVLMLVPLGLMLVHTKGLWSDFNYLKSFYSIRSLAALFLIGLCIIPTIYGITIRNDKKHLDKALKYTYQRGLAEESEVDLNLAGINRALKNIKHINGVNRDGFDIFTTSTPYLTAFYNWYVLDNLSISNKKIRKLEEIFFKESDTVTFETASPDTGEDKDVYINNIKTETKFDPKEGTYRSWIHLEITNKKSFQNEYHTLFNLPEGSYISDYYLYVGKEKKHGLIADKRAANWVYEQVKSERRDPGLLTYIGNNKIDFKIFPFGGNETRKTGIEIVHKTPIKLNMDQNIIELKDEKYANNNPKDIFIKPGIIYVSKDIKETLPKVTRENKYYFVMDYSKGNKDNISNYKRRIEEYIEKNNIQDSVKEIIALNYEERVTDYNKKWEESFRDFKIKGGFYLEYTLKRILYDNYVNNSNTRPIIITVTGDNRDPIIGSDFNNLRFTAPEGLYYYNLNGNKALERYSIIDTEVQNKENNVEKIHEIPVLAFSNNDGRTFYLSNDREDSIVIIDDKIEMKNNNRVKASKWESGVVLKSMYMNYMLHPESYFENSLAIVKNSITNEVMSPLTSFIVLENEAQEKAMLEKQKEILATKKPLDIGDMTPMDEPSLWVIGFIGMLVILFIKRKRRKGART